MEAVDDTPPGGTALIVVPGVGDDAPGDTVASMTRALLLTLGPGAHSMPLTRTIVVPPLPGSAGRPVVHEVRSARIESPATPGPLIVYEMHWADLSRFPGTLRRFVLTLYGLLFQVATIGIEALRAVPPPRWPQLVIRVFSYLTAVLVVGLTAGAAVLGVEFAALVRLTGHDQQLVVAGLALALICALAWLGDRFLRGNGWRFPEVPLGLGAPGVAFGVVAVGAGVVPLIIHARGTPLALAVHDVLWFGVRWVLPIAWGLIAVAAVAVSLTILAIIPSDHGDPAQVRRFHATRTAMLSVVIGGLGIGLLGALLVATGLAVTAHAAGTATPVPARAAIDVGAVVGPNGQYAFGDYAANVFSYTLRPLGVALVCALALVLLIAVSGFRYGSALAQARWSPAAPGGSWWPVTVSAALAAVLVAALADASSPAADAVAIALALVAAAAVVAHWAGRFRPSDEAAPVRRGFDALVTYLGSRLHVLMMTGALLVAAGALLLATPATPAAGRALGRFSESLSLPLTGLARGSGFENGLRISAAVAAIAAIAALVKSRLSVLARALDVAYDVATYMRVPHGSPTDPHPVEPPRRRILRRYAALLDHVQTVQSPQRIIIAAHSQGSMYTLALIFGDEFRDQADLRDDPPGGRWPLAPRLLAPDPASPVARAGREPSPVLTVPLSLVTAGCPILQTYAPSFPGQYDWPADPDAIVARLAAFGPGARWRNVYRSGDYFGRSLWASRVCDPPAPPAGLEEICLGPGHHTGYWGDPLFAERVLEMI